MAVSDFLIVENCFCCDREPLPCLVKLSTLVVNAEVHVVKVDFVSASISMQILTFFNGVCFLLLTEFTNVIESNE